MEADVCVAGAGPAGIAVALELEARGLDVVLLEQGPEVELGGDVDGAYGGYVNPTLTIIALSARLGEHLANEWSRR